MLRIRLWPVSTKYSRPDRSSTGSSGSFRPAAVACPPSPENTSLPVPAIVVMTTGRGSPRRARTTAREPARSRTTTLATRTIRRRPRPGRPVAGWPRGAGGACLGVSVTSSRGTSWPREAGPVTRGAGPVALGAGPAKGGPGGSGAGGRHTCGGGAEPAGQDWRDGAGGTVGLLGGTWVWGGAGARGGAGAAGGGGCGPAGRAWRPIGGVVGVRCSGGTPGAGGAGARGVAGGAAGGVEAAGADGSG